MLYCSCVASILSGVWWAWHREGHAAEIKGIAQEVCHGCRRCERCGTDIRGVAPNIQAIIKVGVWQKRVWHAACWHKLVLGPPVQARGHPEKLWVIKSNKHRGIKVLKAEG